MERPISFLKFLKDKPELEQQYFEWARQAEEHINCIDCKKRHEIYMVTRETWEAANLDSRQNCCLACLNTRLQAYRGDGLRFEDLTDVRCNEIIRWLWQHVECLVKR